jgi:hypothetical protein
MTSDISGIDFGFNKFVPFRDDSFTALFVGLHPTLFNQSASRTNNVEGIFIDKQKRGSSNAEAGFDSQIVTLRRGS